MDKNESGLESLVKTGEEAEINDPKDVNPYRRRFAGAGLGVSAIFTLSSSPILAEVAGVCKSPSGFASGNLSTHGTPVICSGRNVAYWTAITTADSQLDTKFHSVFSRGSTVNYGGTSTNPLSGPTMKEVMAMPSGPTAPQPLGAEVAATWVNIKKGFIPASILTDTKLITMWNEILTTGGYVPIAGATPWLPSQVVTYLRSLQI
jgi:hypothetical protein